MSFAEKEVWRCGYVLDVEVAEHFDRAVIHQKSFVLELNEVPVTAAGRMAFFKNIAAAYENQGVEIKHIESFANAAIVTG